MPENKDPQTELIVKLVQTKKRFEPGGEHGPIEDRNDWDSLVGSQKPEDREVLQELANFSDLWRFLDHLGYKLPEELVSALEQVHKLPVGERVERLRAINQQLMQKVVSVGKELPFRH